MQFKYQISASASILVTYYRFNEYMYKKSKSTPPVRQNNISHYDTRLNDALGQDELILTVL